LFQRVQGDPRKFMKTLTTERKGNLRQTMDFLKIKNKFRFAKNSIKNLRDDKIKIDQLKSECAEAENKYGKIKVY
jgi:hypothetical protein